MSVKDRLQFLVPTMVESRNGWRLDWSTVRWAWRLALILLVVFVLSGWSHWPEELAYIVFVVAIGAALFLHGRTRDRRTLRAWQYAALMILCAVGVSVFLLSMQDSVEVNLRLISMAGACGVVSAGYFADSVKAGRISRDREAMARVIERPVAMQAMSSDSFEPHWPVKCADDLSVWAIDPQRHTLRVMIPDEQDVDAMIAWDAPIRAVDLRLVAGSRRWAMAGNSMRYARGDQDLVVTAGGSEDEWTFTLPFYGTDREQARCWRDTFESWMRRQHPQATN